MRTIGPDAVKATRLRRSRKSATAAGLSHITDRKPGIKRLRRGRGFRYVRPNGKPVLAGSLLKRIRTLAIPPAWTRVWISVDSDSHLQATGRDARGRKQYRYHPRWREVRDENKYDRLREFGRSLPRLRRRVRRDLRSRSLTRNKVLAAIVRLLDLSGLRIGNEAYAVTNRSYGLSTLKDRHARVRKSTLHLRFRGKGGQLREISIDHPRIARIVKRCQDLPGQDLFQWADEQNTVHGVTSGDVNDYIFAGTGENFTSKDFRTWTGTVLAAGALGEADEGGSKRETQSRVLRAVECVATRLGNTPAVCRKCYIHPAIVEAYETGALKRALDRRLESKREAPATGLSHEEKAVLELLRQRKSTAGGSLEDRLKRSLLRVASRRK